MLAHTFEETCEENFDSGEASAATINDTHNLYRFSLALLHVVDIPLIGCHALQAHADYQIVIIVSTVLGADQ